MKTTMAPQALVVIYCAICGSPHQVPRGLGYHDLSHMEQWELDGLVRGYGCPICEGNLPTYIKELPEEEREHIQYGFEHQWRHHLKGALLPRQIPYPKYPEPEADPAFIWAEPSFVERLKNTYPETFTLIQTLQGGIDGLVQHPAWNEPAIDDAARYGLWHVISEDLAYGEAETSSVRCMNVFIIQEIFGQYCDLIEGRCWILIGVNAPEGMSVYLEILLKLVAVESALLKYHALTPQILTGICGIGQTAPIASPEPPPDDVPITPSPTPPVPLLEIDSDIDFMNPMGYGDYPPYTNHYDYEWMKYRQGPKPPPGD